MGQTMGRMPDTLEALLEEKDRVLQWSGEILSKVTDNINEEETLQMDYDNEKADGKVQTWIQENQARVDEILNKYPNASEQCKNQLTSGIDKIREELKTKVRKDYQSAYSDIKKFTKKVDEMGKNQRKLHGEMQELEGGAGGDVKKFQKQFGPLRVKTFNNLKTGEKMIAEDKKLKTNFTKKVNDIDRKIAEECAKKITKVLKDFEKAASK